MFHPAVVVGVQVIVVLEEVSQKELRIVVLELVLDFEEGLFGVKNEFLEFGL